MWVRSSDISPPAAAPTIPIDQVTPAEIGIDDFQANRSPDKRYRTTPLKGLFTRVKGAEKRGPSPELLFAGAYSACYHGALGNAAKKLGTAAVDSTVRALVSLIEDDQGGYRLSVELHGELPGIDRAQVQRIMDEAHKTCPYSKALRGDASVKLVVD